jgi:hypothetical protein
MSVPIVMVVSPPGCIVVVTAVPTVVVAWRPNVYADAPGSRVNTHFCERWHRCRGDERACGNGSRCEFLHGTSFFFLLFSLRYKNDSVRPAVPKFFVACARKVMEHSCPPCGAFSNQVAVVLVFSHGREPMPNDAAVPSQARALPLWLGRKLRRRCVDCRVDCSQKSPINAVSACAKSPVRLTDAIALRASPQSRLVVGWLATFKECAIISRPFPCQHKSQ